MTIGTVVKLISGGPKMTIIEKLNDDEVLCYWFNDESFLQQGRFNKQCLIVSKY